jgi:hypothetical protein
MIQRYKLSTAHKLDSVSNYLLSFKIAYKRLLSAMS